MSDLHPLDSVVELGAMSVLQTRGPGVMSRILVIDDRYEWAKQNGLIKDYRIMDDNTVEIEYWPPLEKITVSSVDKERPCFS